MKDMQAQPFEGLSQRAKNQIIQIVHKEFGKDWPGSITRIIQTQITHTDVSAYLVANGIKKMKERNEE